MTPPAAAAFAALPSLASIHVGPVQFDAPIWLVLIPVLGALCVLMASRSLSGLGSVTRWVALGIRLLVITLIVAAIAEPQWRRESKDVAVTVVLDASQSVPSAKQKDIDAYIEQAAAQTEKKDDRLGVVTAAKEAFVQALPQRLNRGLERQHVGSIDGTNLAAAVRLALAVLPKDAANRILLATDGNETVGSLLQAAEAAKALGVPIDVLPMQYKYDNEVLVDRIVAPSSAREGENINLRVVLKAIKAASGRLTIQQNGESLDLDPDKPGESARVTLKEGINVLSLPVANLRSGPQKFDAIFEPDGDVGRPVGDTILENNKALGVTFVAGEGKVLVLADDIKAAEHLVQALESAKIRAEVRPSERAPASLTEYNAFDAVIMVDQSAYGYSQKQQEELRQYVHDTGGGLIMIGGPNAFGAGGWIGSPLEDALPINLDIPSKRQMPKGALALVIHSCEMPEGVFYGKKVCEAAVNSLSRLDLAGIVEYGWNGTTSWVHKLAPVGDGSAVKRSIQNLMFGDMPDFTPSLQLAYDGLKACDAGQKHVIMISDGDPQIPPASLLDKYIEAKITISTVGVFPHSGGDTSRMKYISQYTKGRHYEVNTQQALASVPQIFIKEAQTVRRSLLWEGSPFTPAFTPGLSESLRGITQVPPISGYVVTAEREGLALVSMKGKEGDPIMAQWQYGLGKVLAFTSDAATRWNSSWIGWPSYKAFWEQNTRWAMRPGGSANVRVMTDTKGDSTTVTVEALDAKGERLNFANFKGRLALPDGKGVDVDLKQVGPGRYQGTVPTDQSGSYVLSLRYAAPDDSVKGGILEGSVQAAVTRPFADEFRAMEDNTPLLTQVATLTGGRVLSWNPQTDDPWSRVGLKMPVALRPMWLIVAVLAAGLFLVDVGVRRVRVDIPAILRWVQSLFGRAGVKGGEQLTGLKAAREQAKAQIARRVGSEQITPHDLEAQAKAAVRASQEVAKTKFEATPESLKRSVEAPIIMGGADAKPQPTQPKARPTDAPKQAPGEGMNRLLKAKQKAREEMDE
ncbi:MAG: VWA domain-containing protein [Planctomycetes bacterium]|nr:VWA domain-containing protein [Planctomycetota bacterium]